MNAQLNGVCTELDEATVRARKAVERVPSALVGRRPHQGSWSIAECIAHLTITTDAYIAVIRPAIDRAREQHLLHRGTTFRVEISARMLAWWLEPPYRLKSKTLAAFVPEMEQPARALPDFVDRQQKLKVLVVEADGLALDRIRISSPFASQMRYSVYAAFRLIAVHQRRHLWQAERVAETMPSGQSGAA